jgi:hypothetical protein
MPEPILLRTVRSCARCSGDHVGILARPLTIPFAPAEAAPLIWTHWAPCPVNGEPILVMGTPDEVTASPDTV